MVREATRPDALRQERGEGWGLVAAVRSPGLKHPSVQHPATDLANLPAPDRTLDATGTLCPYPIVETAKAVKALADGAVLLVLASDPGIATDMPMWCRAMRHEHLATFRDGVTWKSYVRKRARNA